MALEDVVQGVNVKVTTDGVESAKQQLAGLEKAIESLAKQASGAATPGAGGGGGGIPDLTKGLSDLSATGAEAFAQIARGASNGDITGLATLLGGRLAGSVAEAGRALYEFTETQTAAGLKNAAMAKEFGTTPAVMQGLKSSFEEAGVSGAGFERLVNRMSRQVASDYPDMMRNVQESNLRAQKSALGLEEAQRAVQKSFTGNEPERATMRLAEAQEKLQKSYGVPEEAFAAQDKLREQRKLQLDVSDAIEAQDEAYHKEQLKRQEAQIALAAKQEEQRRQELNDIPHIAQLLSSGMDVSEVSVKKLREGIEFLVNPSGQASPVAVLAKEMDLIKSGAIDSGKALELVQQSMGRVGASGGVGGLDAQQVVSLATRSGGDVVRNAQEGGGVVQKLGIAQTDTDTGNFKAFAAQVEEAASIWGALMQKLGSFAASSATPFVKKLAEVGEAIADITEGNYRSGLQKLFYRSDNRPHFEIDDAEKEAQTTSGGTGGGQTQTGQYDQFGQRQYDDTGRRVGGGGPPRPTQYGPEGPIYVQSGNPQPIGNISPLGTPAPVGDATGQIRQGGAEVGGALNEVAAIIRTAASGITGGPMPAGGVPAHWGGGPIRLPGYASGGRVASRFSSNIPGFADGGPIGMQPLLVKAVQKYGPQVLDTIKSYNLATPEGRDKVHELLAGRIAESWGERGIAAGLEGLGMEAAGTVAGTAVGVLTNPFGVGLLDASATHAADRNAGAAQEEAYGRSLGAHNQREMYELLQQGKGIQMADGGAVEDEISKAQEAVAAAEFDAQQHPSKQANERLAYQKMILAKVMAKQGASQRQQQAFDRQKQQREQAEQQTEKEHSAEQAARHGLSSRLQKLGGTALSDLQFAGGGLLPGFAMGSVRGPGTGTSDSILARLSNGEFVMRDAAVRTYGEGFMHAINNMTIPPPKYDSGGMVPMSNLPRYAEGGAMERPGSILNLHVGGEVFSGLHAPAAVADQLRKFAIGQQTTSTGRKPTWAGE